jgi:NADPH-dependent F420 reductase
LGSRDPAKAERIANKLNQVLGREVVRGLSNADAAAQADVVVSALPHKGHLATLEMLKEALRGKLLVVATVIWPPGPLDRQSAAEEARGILDETTRVVAAFQTVSAVSLRALEEEMEDDVLVCSDEAEARQEAVRLIEQAGLRGVQAGVLRNARTVEAMTGVLLQVNKAHSIKHAGIRITGLGSSH